MKIKDLDREFQYSLGGVTEEQAEVVFNWLKENDTGWGNYSIEDFLVNVEENNSLKFESDWFFTERTNPTDESIQKLFYEEEEYIQGNVYLFSNDGLSWEEGVFVTEWNGCFYKESVRDVHLIPFKFIKPTQKYEWYVVDRGVDKQFLQLTEDDVLYYNAQEIHTQKVTNSFLIRNLNEYGNVAEH